MISYAAGTAAVTLVYFQKSSKQNTNQSRDVVTNWRSYWEKGLPKDNIVKRRDTTGARAHILLKCIKSNT